MLVEPLSCLLQLKSATEDTEMEPGSSISLRPGSGDYHVLYFDIFTKRGFCRVVGQIFFFFFFFFFFFSFQVTNKTVKDFSIHVGQYPRFN
jgi:hypothetical protein